jgi:aminoglycoside phosphotransferase (APT) family kinase protein
VSKSSKADGLALVNADRLGLWLDNQGLEGGHPIEIEPLAGGTSNAMFIINRGSSQWVLRRPAKVALERANEGMRREHAILSALEGSDVPHARAVALCDDHTVLGVTFFLMDRVEGINPIPLPPEFDSDHHRTEISLAMVESLARLHRFDWRARGLSGLGRPEHFHERQVTRWSAQLASYKGRELVGIDLVARWLEDNVPEGFTPTVMHGDFHMLNALIAPTPPGRVVAMVDWETATIGDPLLDLAGFCEIWCSVCVEGWPTRANMIDHYCGIRGIDPVGDLTYYDVLYNFRLAVLLEGVYQRSLRDPSLPDQNDLGSRVLTNVARAADLVAGAVS